MEMMIMIIPTIYLSQYERSFAKPLSCFHLTTQLQGTVIIISVLQTRKLTKETKSVVFCIFHCNNNNSKTMSEERDRRSILMILNGHQQYLSTLLSVLQSFKKSIPVTQTISHIIVLCFCVPALFLLSHSMFCWCGTDVAQKACRQVLFGPQSLNILKMFIIQAGMHLSNLLQTSPPTNLYLA